MRSLISRIGEQAGLAAEYWRDGFYFYDRETGARALVEQRYTKDWAGEIHIQTQRGQAQALLERLLQFIDERHVSLGARASGRTFASRALEEASEPAKEVEIKPVPEPSMKTEYFVSYAWNDDTPGGPEREAFVDQLCAAAEKKGIKIIRDKTAMRYGDRISKFMSRIAHGDRIFIVLSDKYLKSAYCMHELFDIWRNCREDDAEFIEAHARFRVCLAQRSQRLRSALNMPSTGARRFEEMEAIVKEHGQLVLSDEDNADYRLMTRLRERDCEHPAAGAGRAKAALPSTSS